MNLRTSNRICAFVFELLIAVCNAHGAEPIAVSGIANSWGMVRYQCEITRDSSSAVFIGDLDTPGTIELYVAPLTGGPRVKLSGAMVDGGQVRDFVITPDSGSVVFLADRDAVGRTELYISPIDGTAPPKNLSGTLVTGGLVRSFLLAPNGATAVFVAIKGTPGIPELYSVSLLGDVPQRLSSPVVVGTGVVSTFRISNNSQYAVFLSNADVAQSYDLYSVPLSGGTPVKLSIGLAPGDGTSPDSVQIAPDSNRVIFSVFKNSLSAIVLYSASIWGGDTAVFFDSPQSGALPVFPVAAISPDSSRVVFRAVREVAGPYELYSVPIAGGSLTKLSGAMLAGERVDLLRLSADSTRAVFVATKDSLRDRALYSVAIDGGEPIRLSGSMVAGGHVLIRADISPDSRNVVFFADKEVDGVNEAYSVPILGGAITKISGTMSSGGGVRDIVGISPDSARVLFVADKVTYNVLELFSASMSGGIPTKISGALVAGGNVYFNPKISRDGQRVLFLADKDVDQSLALYSAKIDGGGALMDIDGDGRTLDDYDVLLLLRWRLGFRGDALIDKATGAGATRRSPLLLEPYLAAIDSITAPKFGGAVLDVDGDGTVSLMTDCLLISRWRLGLRGDALVANAIGTNATRRTASQIENFLAAIEAIATP